MPASALRLAAVSVLVAALTAGCGSDSPKASSDAAPTKAQAEAAAKAINLVAADLPGFESEEADPAGDDTDDQLLTCVGVAPATEVSTSSSDDFSKGAPPNGGQISSEVSVVTSTAAAKKELDAYTSDKAKTCIEDVLGKELTGEIGETPGVTVGKLVLTEGEAVSGTDGAFSYKLSTSVSAAGLNVPIAFTIDGFLVKHTEVSLLTAVFGSDTSVADQRDALLGKLVERAKKSAV